MKRIISIALFLFCLFSLNAQDNYFFVFLNTNPDKEEIPDEEVEALQTAHLQNIERLWKEGKLPVAGPFEGGGGIFIFNTETMAETKELLATDPAVKAGRFKLEVYPFEIFYGSICGVGEEYEMKGRMFCRLKVDEKTRSTSIEIDELIRSEFDKYDRSGSSKILAGGFGEKNGGIWILHGESEPLVDFLNNNDAFEKAGITYETKTLWIAGGIFCE